MSDMLKYLNKPLIALMAFIPMSLFAKEMKIFTTLPVFSMIAQEIAGENAQIDCLTTGQTDPHYLLISPSQRIALENADFVLSGEEVASQLPCEPSKIISLSVLPQGASHELLERRTLVAKWIHEGHGHHSHDEHKHGYHCCHHHQSDTLKQAQHEWLSLACMQIVAEVFAEKIAAFDQENAAVYKERCANFIQKIESIKVHYKNEPQPRKCILYYEEFSLLQKELDVDFGPVLYRCCHNKTLSPQRLAQLMTSDYRVVFIPPFLDANAKSQLQELIQLPFFELDTSGASPVEGTSYAQFMETLLHTLYYGEVFIQSPETP